MIFEHGKEDSSRGIFVEIFTTHAVCYIYIIVSSVAKYS